MDYLGYLGHPDSVDYLNCVGILVLLLLTLVTGSSLRRAFSSASRGISDLQRAMLDAQNALSGVQRSVADVKSDTQEILERLPSLGHVHYPHSARAEEFSVWAYQQGEWNLERECTDPQLEAGPPPGRKGWYEGEVVKTRGIRKQQGQPGRSDTFAVPG